MKTESLRKSIVHSPQSMVSGMRRVFSLVVLFTMFQPNINASLFTKQNDELTTQNGEPKTVNGKQENGEVLLAIASKASRPKTENLKLQTDSAFKHIQTIPIEAKEIQTDRLGNIYVVSKTNQLYKYSNNGKLLSTLNYKYLGNITFVDATNPLEIYVFYKELNLVVFLDNNLAYRGELALSDYNIGQASAIARSFDNGVWVFDLAAMELQKMGKDGSNPLSSGNMRQYTSANSSISYLYDNDDRVFVNDSANGIFVFDVFATYLKTLPIKGCDEVKVIDQELFYHQAHTSTLKKYRLNTFQTVEYPLPESTGIIDISIEKNRLYLLKTGEVVIYGF